jgi:hypothetical protein
MEFSFADKLCFAFSFGPAIGLSPSNVSSDPKAWMGGANHHLKLAGHGSQFEKAKRRRGIAKYRAQTG